MPSPRVLPILNDAAPRKKRRAGESRELVRGGAGSDRSADAIPPKCPVCFLRQRRRHICQKICQALALFDTGSVATRLLEFVHK